MFASEKVSYPILEPCPVSTKDISLGARLQGVFTLCWNSVQVSIEDKGVVWNNQRTTEDRLVLWEDVIAVYPGGVSRGPGVKKCAGKEPELDRFTLHFIEHKEKNGLAHKHVTFEGVKFGLNDWVETIKSSIGRDRPIKLLILKKENTGNCNTKYESIVKPLLDLAGIATEVNGAETTEQIVETAKTYNFEKLDGVLFTNGCDLNAFINAAIKRYNDNVKIDEPDAVLNALPFSVGVIPTGYAKEQDSFSCHGGKDIETETLHVISGKKRYLNLMSVHEEGGPLLSYGNMAVCCGAWGDVLHMADDCVQNKNEKSAFGILKWAFCKKREFYVEGEYLPVERCPTDARLKTEEHNEPLPDGWIPFSGDVIGINSLPMGLYHDEDEPKLKQVDSGIGINLIIQKPNVGSFRFLKFMYDLCQGKNNVFEQPHIEEHLVKAYRFRILGKDSELTTKIEILEEKEKSFDQEKEMSDDANVVVLTDKEHKLENMTHLFNCDGRTHYVNGRAVDVRLKAFLVQYYGPDVPDLC